MKPQIIESAPIGCHTRISVKTVMKIGIISKDAEEPISANSRNVFEANFTFVLVLAAYACDES